MRFKLTRLTTQKKFWTYNMTTCNPVSIPWIIPRNGWFSRVSHELHKTRYRLCSGPVHCLSWGGAAKHILRYIGDTINTKMVIVPIEKSLVGYFDADNVENADRLLATHYYTEALPSCGKAGAIIRLPFQLQRLDTWRPLKLGEMSFTLKVSLMGII